MATKTVPKPQVVKPVVRVNMPAQAATVTSLAADVVEMKLMLLQLKMTVNTLDVGDYPVSRKNGIYHEANNYGIMSYWNTNWTLS